MPAAFVSTVSAELTQWFFDCTENDICSAELRKRYAQDPADAKLLLSVGDAPVSEGGDPNETAAWAQLSTTLLASDVAILMY